jgi:hypothetical protein
MEVAILFYTLPNDTVGYTKPSNRSNAIQKTTHIIRKGTQIPLRGLSIYYDEKKRSQLGLPSNSTSAYHLVVEEIGDWEIYALCAKWRAAFDAGLDESTSLELRHQAKMRSTDFCAQVLRAMRQRSRAKLGVVELMKEVKEAEQLLLITADIHTPPYVI